MRFKSLFSTVSIEIALVLFYNCHFINFRVAETESGFVILSNVSRVDIYNMESQVGLVLSFQFISQWCLLCISYNIETDGSQNWHVAERKKNTEQIGSYLSGFLSF